MAQSGVFGKCERWNYSKNMAQGQTITAPEVPRDMDKVTQTAGFKFVQNHAVDTMGIKIKNIKRV